MPLVQFASKISGVKTGGHVSAIGANADNPHNHAIPRKLNAEKSSVTTIDMVHEFKSLSADERLQLLDQLSAAMAEIRERGDR